MPPWRVSLAVGLLWQLSCYPDTGKYRIEGGAGGAGATDASAGGVAGNASGGRTGGALGAGGTGGTKAGGTGGVVVGAGGAGGAGGLGAGGILGQGGAIATGGASAMGGATGGTNAGGMMGGMGGAGGTMSGVGGAGGTDTTAHDLFVGKWSVAGSHLFDCMGMPVVTSLQNAPLDVTTGGGAAVVLALDGCALVMQVSGNTATLTAEQQCNDVPPFKGDYLYQAATFTVMGSTASLTRTGVADLMMPMPPFHPGGHCTFTDNLVATRDPPP